MPLLHLSHDRRVEAKLIGVLRSGLHLRGLRSQAGDEPLEAVVASELHELRNLRFASLRVCVLPNHEVLVPGAIDRQNLGMVSGKLVLVEPRLREPRPGRRCSIAVDCWIPGPDFQLLPLSRREQCLEDRKLVQLLINALQQIVYARRDLCIPPRHEPIGQHRFIDSPIDALVPAPFPTLDHLFDRLRRIHPRHRPRPAHDHGVIPADNQPMRG